MISSAYEPLAARIRQESNLWVQNTSQGGQPLRKQPPRRPAISWPPRSVVELKPLEPRRPAHSWLAGMGEAGETREQLGEPLKGLGASHLVLWHRCCSNSHLLLSAPSPENIYQPCA